MSSSSQERILFQQLVVQGHVPDLAIFVDGLNEFDQAAKEPIYSDGLRQSMEMRGRRSASLVSALSLWLPLCMEAVA